MSYQSEPKVSSLRLGGTSTKWFIETPKRRCVRLGGSTPGPR